MKKITLMLFMMMLSLCAHAQLPQEGFETWPVTGGGWAIYQNGVGANTWLQGNGPGPFGGFPNQTGSSAYVVSQNVPPPGQPIDYLVTKSFTVPTNPKLTFMSKFSLGGDQGNIVDVLITRISDNPTGDPAAPTPGYVSLIGPNGWTESQTNTQQQQWTAKELTIPATYVNQQVRIAFVYKSVNNTQTERWFIDNVQVDSDCLTPSYTVTNPTTNTVQINITVNPSNAANFAAEIISGTQTPDGVADYTWSGNTFTVPGLIPDTDYKVYVWALCSPTNPSDVTGPVNISTRPIGITCAQPIIANTTPFQTTNNTADFGDDIEGNPGAGCNATGTNFLNGNEVFYAYTPDFTGDVSIVMTNNGPNSGMFVYASCADVGNNCIAGGIGNATTPVNIPLLAVTAGTTYYIAISSSTVQSTPYTLTIQQVGCTLPGNPTVDAATIGSSTAEYSWTNPSGASSWQVVTQAQGLGLPTVSSTIEIATTNDHWPKTGMDPATDYEYYVRADCGNGSFSAWAGPVRFSTTQVAAILPYTEDFEGVHNFSIKNGTQTNKWVVGPAVNNGGAKSLYISNDTGTTNAYSLTNVSTVQAYRDIAVPAGAQQINIAFDWRAMGEGTTSDYMRVWSTPISYNPNAATLTTVGNSGGTLVGTYNMKNTWQNASVTIPSTAFAGQTRRIVFEWRNDGSGGVQPPAAVDNINISVVTCSVPSALTAITVNPNNATIGWTAAPFNAESYDYYYSTSSTPPTAATPEMGTSGTNTANLINLDDATTYYFWVRSDCGAANGNSFWVGPLSFLTPQIPAPLTYTDQFEGPVKWTLNNGTQTNKWVVGAATSNGGTKSLYVTNDGTANAYTTTSSSVVHAYRDLQMPGSPLEQILISFDWKAVGETTADRLRVYLVPATFTPTPGTQITANAQNIPVGLTNYSLNPNWQTSTAIIPALAFPNQVRRLVFEWRNDGSGGAQPPAAVDNLSVSVITCPSPTNVAAGAITPTSAVVNWTGPVTVAPTYDFYVSTHITSVPTATTTPTGNVATNTVTLDDEIPTGSTNFYFWVRSNCGSGDTSLWIGPLQIGLPQVQVPMDYFDDLEGAIRWTVVNGTQPNKWVVGSAVSNSPTTSLYISNNDGIANNYTTTTSSVTHVYRDIQIPANTTDIAVSFDWRAFGEGTNDRLRAWLVPVSFTPTAGTQITAGAGRVQIGQYSGSAAWQNVVAVLNEAANSGLTRRLVFEWRNDGSNGTQPAAAVDNINVKIITCPAVTNLAANGTDVIGDIVLTWTPVGTETQWEIVVQESSLGAPSTNPPTVITVSGTPSHLITLPAGVFYEFYVRPVCSPTDKGFWAGPVEFSVFAPPACAKVDLFDQDLNVIPTGQNLSICPGEDACIDLTAQYLQTGNTTSYAVEAIEYAPQFPFTGGIELNITSDDIWGAPFTFPSNFNFCFYGQKQTKAQVGSNGLVTFDTYATGSTCQWNLNALQIPNTNFPIKNAIYGVYQDIYPPENNDFAHPSINYQILGTYPCRAFVVNFSEVAQFGNCDDDPTVGAQTSQIVFYEITNIIEVYVKRRVPCMEWPTSAAQAGQGVIGIQNAAGTAAVAAPGRNTGAWTAIEEAYRFTPNGPSNTIFEWFKGSDFYSSNPTINVCITEPTVMKARVTYSGCGITPNVVESLVTITPEQPIIVTQTTDLSACVANPGDNATFNLSDGMVGAIANPENYTFTYYETQALADLGNVADQLPVSYVTNTTKTIYVRVQLTGRSCYATDTFEVIVNQGPLYDLTPGFTLCQGTTGTIAISNANFDLNDPSVTYTWTHDTNPIPDNTSSITVSAAGVYEVTVKKGNCTLTKSTTVAVTPTPSPDILPDVTECESYTLQPLSANNSYYTGSGATGTMLNAGDVITTTQTIYVYVTGATPGCTSEDSFVVNIVPKPVATAPASTTVCQSYTLPALTVGNYYDAPGGTGNMLTAGQIITSTQTLYVYAVSATPTPTPCVDEDSFTITITPDVTADVISPVVACEEYELLPLSANNNYYTGPGATGTMLSAGTVITQNQTVYIYAQDGTCNDESSFTINLVPQPFITSTQGCDGGSYVLEVIFENGSGYNAGNTTIEWKNSSGITIGSTAKIIVSQTGTYYVTVTPVGGTCSSDPLEVTVTETGCMIQRGISPNGDGLNDTFDLTAFNVTKLSIFNRYGKEVYTFNNYTNQWHGQTSNGNELPTGTYFYMIERVTGENSTGWIYINREE